jgi:hypothetical protein
MAREPNRIADFKALRRSYQKNCRLKGLEGELPKELQAKRPRGGAAKGWTKSDGVVGLAV